MNVSKQKISPFLWFDHQAEEAARFYASIFEDSSVGRVTHYSEGAPMPKGTVMTVAFTLGGTKFTALNGGPMFPFTEAVSFVVHCDTQEEIDRMWDTLTAGGKEVQCGGWLKDKYGLSWQVVPTMLDELFDEKNPEGSQRAMGALMEMKKLDIAALQRAYDDK